jgi:cytochrome c oxidase cbb3-type subunit 3
MHGRRVWMRIAVSVGMAALGVTGGRLAAQTPAPQYAPTDIQFGAKLYTAQCTACHGPTGDGIVGVDLASGVLRRAPTDAAFRTLLANGIPGTAMPAFKFDPSELTMIIAFVRNMRTFDSSVVTVGDEGRGQLVFEGAGKCTNCHRVNGKGPLVAPELSDIGAVRSADVIQRTLLDPDASIQPVNRSVRAVTRGGEVVTGRRLNEDTYSVQLIDEHERLRSFFKADLKDYSVIMSSKMPSYRTSLSTQDLADVVAYLLSLKGIK